MSHFEFAAVEVDLAACRESLQDSRCGGYAAFEGWVRDVNEGQRVLRLEYEAYEALGVKEGERIVAEAIERYGVIAARCVHRLGELQLGELAVWVGVSSPHRDEAFEAARFCIDTLKATVPIWKREAWDGGESWGLEPQHVTEIEDLDRPAPTVGGGRER